MNITIKIKKLDKKAKLTKIYETDACFDISALTSENIIINPGERSLIHTGIILNLPNNYEAQIRPRSGLALNYGITVLNSPGTIDPSFTGEIKIILINHGTKSFQIKSGDRIAQICFRKIEQFNLVFSDEISIKEISDRNQDGLGSTGIN